MTEEERSKYFMKKMRRLAAGVTPARADTGEEHYYWANVLKECRERKSRGHAIHVYRHFLERSSSRVQLGDDLLITLAKCGALEEACQIFHHLPSCNVLSWTALISGYVESGQGSEALTLYQQMQEKGLEPNCSTMVALLRACGSVADLEMGEKLHGDARRMGFTSNPYVANTLVFMYGQCGSILEAENVFVDLLEHDVVSWNAMLSSYVKQKQGVKALRLYRQMQEINAPADERTFVSALQACGNLVEEEGIVNLEGQSIKPRALEIIQGFHIDIKRKGFASHVFVGNTLVSVYAKCSNVVNAEIVFVAMSEYVLVSWNAMLSAYVAGGHGERALQLYRHIREQGLLPNARTFVSALQACGILADKEENVLVNGQFMKVISLKICQELHMDIRNNGFTTDLFVANTLLVVYGKCGSITAAERVFIALTRRNHVSWCALLSAYVDQGHEGKALQLYRQMQNEGVTPDQVTFLIVLHACSTLAEKEKTDDKRSIKLVTLNLGLALRADYEQLGNDITVFIASALMDLYAKCGSVVDAEKIFNGLSQRDVVCWSTMLLAYVEHRQFEKALEFYIQLQKEQVVMDDIVLVCLLQACREIGMMEISRKIHFSAVSAGLDHTSFLANALIDSYGNCASMADSQAVFDALFQPDFVSQSACLAGYALVGSYKECLQSLEKMQIACLKLDEVVLLSLLSACSHAGLVDRGLEFLQSMGAHDGVVLDLKHYAVMVDLLGRAGDFSRLENMLSKMPVQANIGMWLCLLGACCTHGNVELGKRAFEHAVHLQPEGAATAYILMSNIYVKAGMQDLANDVEACRKKVCLGPACFEKQNFVTVQIAA